MCLQRQSVRSTPGSSQFQKILADPNVLRHTCACGATAIPPPATSMRGPHTSPAPRWRHGRRSRRASCRRAMVRGSGESSCPDHRNARRSWEKWPCPPARAAGCASRRPDGRCLRRMVGGKGPCPPITGMPWIMAPFPYSRAPTHLASVSVRREAPLRSLPGSALSRAIAPHPLPPACASAGIEAKGDSPNMHATAAHSFDPRQCDGCGCPGRAAISPP
jgi:hypothetical protein